MKATARTDRIRESIWALERDLLEEMVHLGSGGEESISGEARPSWAFVEAKGVYPPIGKPCDADMLRGAKAKLAIALLRSVVESIEAR